MSTFDRAFAEHARNRRTTQARWDGSWPREDTRIDAIKALLNSAPTYRRGAPKTPEAAILAAIREVLSETR